MGDPAKFASLSIYHVFNVSFICLLLFELICFLVTTLSSKGGQKSRHDRGSMLLMIISFFVCIYCSCFFVSHSMPFLIRSMRFPALISIIGVVCIWLGIILRFTAIYTLKKAFTYNVQTTSKQKLITNGLYHIVRNPAYTGSILSLISVALSFRSIPALVLVILVCYSTRIHVGEQALGSCFGDEFTTYQKQTPYRIIPYLW